MIVKKSETSKLKDVDFDQLVFGRTFTDHMVCCDFDGTSWGEMELLPLQSFEYHPATHAFHYGQAIFEGLKGYRTDSGDVNLFRIHDNIKRLNLSAQRMAMPVLDEVVLLEAITQWMSVEKAWVPRQDQGSLYIRPFMIATSPTLRAIPSVTFRFMLIGSPVGFYYDMPIRVKLESKYSRAVKGGVGYAKAAGNYAAAFMPSVLAKDEGFDQLLWTDRSNHQYLEELGSANMFIVVNGVVYTPAIHDSILAGITRDSVIQLLRKQGVEVREEAIPKAFLAAKLASSEIECMFATGTAAAITFIKEIDVDGKLFSISSTTNEAVNQVKLELESLKFDKTTDSFGWNKVI